MSGLYRTLGNMHERCSVKVVHVIVIWVGCHVVTNFSADRAAFIVTLIRGSKVHQSIGILQHHYMVSQCRRL
jgi:hypothetical protein